MAFFAEIADNNIVLQIIKISDSELLDSNGVEQEALGQLFCQSSFGGSWLETNGSIRKKYADVGFTYDPRLDAFYAPQPYKSWGLNESSCNWEPPISKPIDGKEYNWDEATLTWIEITE